MISNAKFWLILPLLTCVAISPVVPVQSARADGSTFQTAQGGKRGILSFRSGPLQTMTPAPFTLELLDASGTTVADAEVSCEMTMPAMPMPENRPRVVLVGNHYQGEAIFTMAGAWRMTCRIAPSSGPKTALTFDIPEVRLK